MLARVPQSGRGRLGRRIMLIGVVAATIAAAPAPGHAQFPAGSTNAVLSFIDAAGNHVSVNRHWPGAPQDTEVFPFVPYSWDGCLPFQQGALMLLLTGPGVPPPSVSSEDYLAQYTGAIAQTAASALSGSLAQLPAGQASMNLQQIVADLTIPGTPANEALKAAAPFINTLNAYEDYGYAVFMFIRWKMISVLGFPVPTPCDQVDITSVPEGYGIPFVAHTGAGPIPMSAQARW